MLTVQVNLRTIAKNVTTIKKHLRVGTKFCAVVKDNAYGLGLVRIGKFLAPLVDCFAVATVAEGIALRQAGIRKDILLLGICDDIPQAIKHNLIITVENLVQAQTIVKKLWHPRIHLAVNTSMNRFGFSSVHELREALQTLCREHVEGVYTHLAYEAEHSQLVKNSLAQFQRYVRLCQKYFAKLTVHAGCSGVISLPAAHYDMLRVGKALYGGSPETQTALTVTSQIVAVKKVKPNTTIGYNGTFTVNKASVIGIVHGGYANGIPTLFSNTVSVLVGKHHCPVIGRVCMDYFFIDVSKVANPLGQTVTIIAPQAGQGLLDLARQAKMVTCDLLLQLNRISS